MIKQIWESRLIPTSAEIKHSGFSREESGRLLIKASPHQYLSAIAAEVYIEEYVLIVSISSIGEIDVQFQVPDGDKYSPLGVYESRLPKWIQAEQQ